MLPRIRTIPSAVREIKEKDPNSYINVPLLRKWVKSGIMPVVPCGGTHILLDMDKLERLLNGEEVREISGESR